MSTSTKTRSGPNTSTKATKIPTSTSLYVTQTDFSTIIKEFKESLKEIISEFPFMSPQIKADSNKFSSKIIVNETASSEDHFESKFQARIYPYDQSFEK